jgi:hypothetical protein
MGQDNEALVAQGILKPESLLWDAGILDRGKSATSEHWVAYSLRRLSQAGNDADNVSQTVTGLKSLFDRLNQPAEKKVSLPQQVAGRIHFGDVDWVAVVKIFEEKRFQLGGLTDTLNSITNSNTNVFLEWKNPAFGGWQRLLSGQLPQLKEAYIGLKIVF